MPSEARRPAESFPPGEFLREELEAREWTQSDLADILGRPLQLVNEIIAAKRRVTPETARGLAAAFGTSAQFWLNLEATYQSFLLDEPDRDVERRARIYLKAPVKEMIKRHWIQVSEQVDVLEKRVLNFFEINNLDEEPDFCPHAARRSTTYSSLTPGQLTWLFRVKHLARTISVGAFSPEKLEPAFQNIRALLKSPEDIRLVPRLLTQTGIRFLIVEPLPKTRIDGVCFWLDEGSPVIAISMRFDRIDYFWFTLLHEVGHVRKRDGITQITLDTDLGATLAPEELERPEHEKEADRFAAEILIPRNEMEDFMYRARPLYSKARIQDFARAVGVHPGIVVGQLHYRGEVPYSADREMLVKVRDIVTKAAVADGWGSLPSPGR